MKIREVKNGCLILMMIVMIVVITGCTLNTPETSTSPLQTDAPSPTMSQQRDIDDQGVSTPTSSVEIWGFAVQRYCEKTVPCQVENEAVTQGSQLIIFSPTGQHIKAIYIPFMGKVVHIASKMPFSDEDQMAIIVLNYESGEYQLMIEGTVTRAFDGTNIYNLKGADGQQVFAMSYLPGKTGIGGTDSGLSEIQVSPGVGPMVISRNPETLVVPVAIRGNGEQPPNDEYVDLWYTLKPYGIGGSIIYPQYRGLYYLLGNEIEHLELLPDTLQFSALSHDGSYVAFTEVPQGDMKVRDLRTYSEITFPLLPSSDLGAGQAVFSPDSKRVAWMEAETSKDPGAFDSTIRMASVTGTSLADVPSSVFQEVVGHSNIWVKPVSWLDNERLLVQVMSQGVQNSGYVIIMQANGSLEETIFQGDFVGLVY